jgi:hypothetical protein
MIKLIQGDKMLTLDQDTEDTTAVIRSDVPESVILSQRPRLLTMVTAQPINYELCVPLHAFEEVTIGRHRENIMTLADVYVSRRHCTIQVGEKGFLLRERAPLNSTSVNDTRCTPYKLLAPGDFIQVGSQTIKVYGNQSFVVPQNITPHGYVVITTIDDLHGQMWRELITTLGWPTIRLCGDIDANKLPQLLSQLGQSNILLNIVDTAYLSTNFLEPQCLINVDHRFPSLGTYDPALKNLDPYFERCQEWGFIDLVCTLQGSPEIEGVLNRLKKVPWLLDAAQTNLTELRNVFGLQT